MFGLTLAVRGAVPDVPGRSSFETLGYVAAVMAFDRVRWVDVFGVCSGDFGAMMMCLGWNCFRGW